MWYKYKEIARYCCRHPVAGAATHARHQQEDGRGAEGYLRLLGEGAAAPRRAQRYVEIFCFIFLHNPKKLIKKYIRYLGTV